MSSRKYPMPLDMTPAEIEQLRRRAGITTQAPAKPASYTGEPTAAYKALNPEKITFEIGPADLRALIAALDMIDNIRGLPTVHYLLNMFKEKAGRLAPRPPSENPYHQTAVVR